MTRQVVKAWRSMNEPTTSALPSVEPLMSIGWALKFNRLKISESEARPRHVRRALQISAQTSALRAHEITGAVYDTLAQIALMRGDYEGAAEHLTRAAGALGNLRGPGHTECGSRAEHGQHRPAERLVVPRC